MPGRKDMPKYLVSKMGSLYQRMLVSSNIHVPPIFLK